MLTQFSDSCLLWFLYLNFCRSFTVDNREDGTTLNPNSNYDVVCCGAAFVVVVGFPLREIADALAEYKTGFRGGVYVMDACL